MRIEPNLPLRSRRLAMKVLAVACLAAWNLGISTSQAEAGRLDIPAWSFDRGNAKVYASPDEYARVHRRLLDTGEVRDQFLAIDTPSGPRSVLLSGVLIRDEEDEPAWIDGLLVDVTAARGGAADREVQQLRASESDTEFLYCDQRHTGILGADRRLIKPHPERGRQGAS